MRNTPLTLLILLVLLVPLVSADLYVNEFVSNPSGDEPDTEWIEIYADSEYDSLENYLISDGEETFSLPDVALATGQHLLLVHTADDDTPDGAIEYGADANIQLSNDEDEVLLYDDQNNLLDSISYGPDDDDDIQAPGEDEAVSRFHDGFDELQVTDTLTPGQTNNILAQFIGQENYVFNENELDDSDEETQVIRIVLSEFFSDADGDELAIDEVILEEESAFSIQILDVDDDQVLEITADENNNGQEVVTINVVETISDFHQAIHVQPVNIIINEQNDAPTITSDALTDALELVPYSYTLTVEDIDNDQEDLSIDAATSTIDGEEIDADLLDGLTLSILPQEVETFEISLVVTDGEDTSEAQVFSLTVEPGIEILEESIVVTREDGTQLTLEEGVSLAPGEEARVGFNYVNNIDGEIAGFVDLAAFTNVDPDFVDFEDTDFALFPRNPTAAAFDMTVPHDLNENFVLTLQAADEVDDGRAYLYQVDVPITLVRNTKDVHLNDISFEDTTLTCTRVAVLNLDYTNTGETDLVGQVAFFDAPATFDAQTGEFDREPEFSYADLQVLEPGETAQDQFEFDFREFDQPQTVHAYFVSPFFGDVENGLQIAAQGQASITTTGTCLNIEALEEQLVIERDSQEQIQIDFFAADDDGNYLFLLEDTDITDATIVTLEAQSNEDLIFCDAVIDDDDNNFLTCEELAPGQAGQSTLTLQVAHLNNEDALDYFVNQTVEIRVTPKLEIVDLLVGNLNENDLQEQGVTLTPLDTLSASLRVENFLEEDLVSVEVTFVDANNDDEFDFIDAPQTNLNLAAGERSAIQNLEYTIPANAPNGEFEVAVQVSGQTRGGDQITTTSEFTLTIERQQSQLQFAVQGEPLDLTCSNQITLDVQVTNTGLVNEDDIFIIIKEDNTVLADSSEGGFLVINPGRSEEIEFTVPIESAGDHTLTVEVQHNFANPDNFEQRGLAADVQQKTVDVTKSECVSETLPAQTDLVLQLGASQEFSASIEQEEFVPLVEWKVNDQVAARNQLAFTFQADQGGEFNISVVLDQRVIREWSVTVADRPISQNFQTSIPQDGQIDLENFEDFTLENDQVKIEFLEPVNLEGLFDLDAVITVGDAFVSVDSDNAAGLAGRQARVTLKNFQTNGNSQVYRFASFGDPADLDDRELCQDQCSDAQQTNEGYAFTVESFSTYVAVNEQESQLTGPAEVSFNNAARGQTTNVTIQLTNTGTQATIRDIDVDVSEFADKFQASVLSAPQSIAPESSADVTLQIFAPESLDSGTQSVGTLAVTSSENNLSIPVEVSLETFLNIKSIDINGKSSGDLSIEDSNEFEIEVENTYHLEMEDVTVEVVILDVDGDDVDEESDEEDIREGRDETFSVDIDISNEDIDEEDYTVEFIVEGEAEDGSRHRIVETKVVDVDLEKHKVIIDRASVTPRIVQCRDNANVQVTVKNIGKNDEDEVEVRIRNSQLGIDSRRDNIEVDDFTRSSNDERVSFPISIDETTAGTYPITVELYLEGDLEETRTIELDVRECQGVSQQVQQDQQVRSQQTQNALAQQLQRQLQAQPSQIQDSLPAATTSTTSTFRNSTPYLVMLGVLTALVMLAVILSLVVLVAKKR